MFKNSLFYDKGEYMKSIYRILMFVVVTLIILSCKENTTEPPIPKNESLCDTLPNWISTGPSQRIYYPLRDVLTSNEDGTLFIFRILGYGNYFFSNKKNEITPISVDLISKGELRHFNIQSQFFACPYNKNKFMFIIGGYNNLNEVVTHWYIYDADQNSYKKITPSKYNELGIGINIAFYESTGTFLRWLSSSSEGNDLFSTSKGVYHLQKEELVEKYPDNLSVISTSPNGKYKWFGYRNLKYGDPNYNSLNLNGVKIEGNYINNTEMIKTSMFESMWSQDSKYMSVVSLTNVKFYPFSFNELHIINVEKTFQAGKIVIDKTIDLIDNYCCFRAGSTAQYISNGKLLVSMSNNQKDLGILYEIDINSGQRKIVISD
jgi:hypothetical protein